MVRAIQYNVMFGQRGVWWMILLAVPLFFKLHFLFEKTGKYARESFQLALDQNPDILSLNEVLATQRETHELWETLKRRGYKLVVTDVKPRMIGTVLATKYDAVEVPVDDFRKHFSKGICALFIPQLKLVVVTAHFDLREEAKRMQFRLLEVFGKLQQEKGNRYWVMGDFNDELTQGQLVHSLSLINVTGNTYCTSWVLKQVPFRWHSLLKKHQLDHILVSRELRVRKQWTTKGRSDHFLLGCDVDLSE